MWYFIAGAVLGVAQLILLSSTYFIHLIQTNYAIQGALTAALLGAGVYGTVFWLIGTIFL